MSVVDIDQDQLFINKYLKKYSTEPETVQLNEFFFAAISTKTLGHFFQISFWNCIPDFAFHALYNDIVIFLQNFNYN